MVKVHGQALHPLKLTAGTPKLVVWVDVSPFPRGYFQIPCLFSGVFCGSFAIVNCLLKFLLRIFPGVFE